MMVSELIPLSPLRLFGKGGYVFGSIGLFFCLSLCKQHHSNNYEQIAMKFYGGGGGGGGGGIWGGKTKNSLNFSGDLGLLR